MIRSAPFSTEYPVPSTERPPPRLMLGKTSFSCSSLLSRIGYTDAVLVNPRRGRCQRNRFPIHVEKEVSTLQPILVAIRIRLAPNPADLNLAVTFGFIRHLGRITLLFIDESLDDLGRSTR